MEIKRNSTRSVQIGSISVGANHPIAVQSMTATHTTNVDATVALVNDLQRAGADIVRIAVDSDKDAEALAEIRKQTSANLSVDLQENYRLVEKVAPHVDKVRYNPGHLYHHEKQRPWQDKVKFLADTAGANNCALRVGVNCGSVDPGQKELFDHSDSIGPMLASAFEHCELLDKLGFTRYVVSLKDSDPTKVVEVNKRFAEKRHDVPLHLGVTEAGLPPDGIIKTRIAFEQLIGRGIGDTIRVSLTVPNSKKSMEIEAGGLFAYGVNVVETYRHAAVFVDKILRGAKPADLPIEQPTKYVLVVNLKTAKVLGLTIPQSLLMRAEVIQ